MKYFTACLCIAIIVLPASGLCEQKSINWYRADIAPGVILRGPMKGQGYIDVLLDAALEALPDYRQTFSVANYARTLKQMKIGNACCPAMYRTPERESYIAFSKPVMVGFTNGVHILKKRYGEFKPFIDGEGYLHIDRLFKETNLKMGVSHARKYGGPVDEIVSANPHSENIIVNYEAMLFADLIRTMSAERSIDYIFGYPYELGWMKKQGKLEKEVLFLPIKGMPRFKFAYIGCSKNEWGLKIIEKINEAFQGGYPESYLKAYRKYLPADLVPLHEEFVEKGWAADANE